MVPQAPQAADRSSLGLLNDAVPTLSPSLQSLAVPWVVVVSSDVAVVDLFELSASRLQGAR